MDTPLLLSRVVMMLPTDIIYPNPSQPRRQFDPVSLRELSDSIRRFGVLQPLTVRQLDSCRYELVAGERRLRAARLAGMDTVPCLLLDIGSQESGLLALIENLQRKDLDFIEEAEGLRQLIQTFGMSQDEAAACISKSQSAVANKLRILRLPPALLDSIRRSGLTERHARALLRLPGMETQYRALEHILRHNLNVAQTEAYIEDLLRGLPAAEQAEQPKAAKKAPVVALKDVRIFLNTITRGLNLMNRSGVNAVCERREEDGALVLTIRIPPPGKSQTDHDPAAPAPA